MEHVCKVLKRNTESPKEQLISQTMHYQPFLNMAIIENWLSSKCCKFVKIHFFSTILLHTHLQYVWNMSAKYQKRILKAVGGVDFTKYALLALWQTSYVYKQWSKNGYVKNCCKFVKNYFFSIIILHAHLQYVWNMSAKY